MSTTATTTLTPPVAEEGDRSHPVLRATLAAGVIAALGVTALAAAADGAGVPLAIDGETIPLLGFAQMTLIGAVIGGLLAAALNRFVKPAQRLFTLAAAVLTALSCVPSVAMPPDVATKVVLVATHLLAAAIVVPALARQTRP
jgi:hypothetical protein